MQPKNWKLYVIIDRSAAGKRDMLSLAESVIKGGADVIQLRDKVSSEKEIIKDAHRLRTLTRKYKIPFIINDRVDIAAACDADGVHLGQDDLPVSHARPLLGNNRLIGVSTHSIEQAKKAQEDGADYIGIGPIFPTPTKPDRRPIGLGILKKIKTEISIPSIAIGGIHKDNLGDVLNSGARAVCVIGASLSSSDVEDATRTLKNIIKQSHDTIRTCP